MRVSGGRANRDRGNNPQGQYRRWEAGARRTHVKTRPGRFIWVRPTSHTITLSMKRGLAVNLDIWVEPEPVQGPAD